MRGQLGGTCSGSAIALLLGNSVAGLERRSADVRDFDRGLWMLMHAGVTESGLEGRQPVGGPGCRGSFVRLFRDLEVIRRSRQPFHRAAEVGEVCRMQVGPGQAGRCNGVTSFAVDRWSFGDLTIVELAMRIFVLLFGLLVSACSSLSEETSSSFSISLVQPAMSCGEARGLSLPDLDTAGGDPLVTTASLKSYSWEDHAIEVDKDIFLRKWKPLFNVEGRVFLVSVESEPIYAGALIASVSSSSCSLPVIAWPRWDLETEAENAVFLELSLGYPTSDYFEGADPRSDARILRALKEVGKMRPIQYGTVGGDLP